MSAFDPGTLRALLRESLALWGIEGDAEDARAPDAVAIVSGLAKRVTVERAEPGSPFAWLVRWCEPGEAQPRVRPCASVAGILTALRLAFGLERGNVVRIAPASAAPAQAIAQPSPDSPLPENDESAGRLPVIVLTGFLGSGKTTLLGNMLRHPDMRRTAVIVNEFGEIGLDHDLIEASDEQLVALTNGCLCCRVRSDLARTLDELFARRSQDSVPPFDRVVIETSGLAEPAPILHTLMTDPALNERYRLASVVTTVDAVCGAATLAAQRESVNQAALADRLVVTKCDLSPEKADALEPLLSSLNPHAVRLRSEHGALDPSALFAALPDGNAPPEPAPRYRAIGIGDDLHAGREIVAVSLVRARPIHAVTLSLFLSALAENYGEHLLRMKGLVQIVERPDAPAVVHGVQHVFHEPEWRARWPSADRRTRIVFIGRRIRLPWLELLLDSLESEVVARTDMLTACKPVRSRASSAD